MNNYPPFFVGQEVVCIDATSITSDFPLVEGNTYTIQAIKKGCCDWEVDVGYNSLADLTYCTVCKNLSSAGHTYWLRSKRFAPKDQFKAISFTKVMETELTSVN